MQGPDSADEPRAPSHVTGCSSSEASAGGSARAGMRDPKAGVVTREGGGGVIRERDSRGCNSRKDGCDQRLGLQGLWPARGIAGVVASERNGSGCGSPEG